MTTHLMNSLAAVAVTMTAFAFATAPAVARLPDDATGSVSLLAPSTGAAAVFGTLHRAPATAIPNEVGRAIALMPSLRAKIAVDPSQVRQAIVGSRTMYLAPLDDGLCIFIADGSSVCSQHLDAIAESGLALEVVPPVRGRVDPVNPPLAPVTGPVTVYGVAPDGITSVMATTTTGDTATSPVVDNAFVIVTDRPVIDIAMKE